jgi:hypothetical protein
MAGKTAKQLGMTRAQAKAHRQGRRGSTRSNPSEGAELRKFYLMGKEVAAAEARHDERRLDTLMAHLDAELSRLTPSRQHRMSEAAVAGRFGGSPPKGTSRSKPRSNPSLRGASALFVNPSVPTDHDYYELEQGWDGRGDRVWLVLVKGSNKSAERFHSKAEALDWMKAAAPMTARQRKRAFPFDNPRKNPALPSGGSFYLRTEASGGRDKRTSRKVAERVVKAPMNCKPGPGTALLLLHVPAGYSASDVAAGHGTVLWEYCGVRVGRERSNPHSNPNKVKTCAVEVLVPNNQKAFNDFSPTRVRHLPANYRVYDEDGRTVTAKAAEQDGGVFALSKASSKDLADLYDSY